MVGIGLNWWQSILTIFLSQFISSLAMFFNSRCASVYHIGYPIVGRSVYGMYGSFYFVGVSSSVLPIWRPDVLTLARFVHSWPLSGLACSCILDLHF